MKTCQYGALALAVTLTACGGGGSSSGGNGSTEPEAPSKTGVFTDSAVAGIQYQTQPGNKSGQTNAFGEYDYVEGDTVTFRIGDTQLPAVTATGRVTPADMADGNDAYFTKNTLFNTFNSCATDILLIVLWFLFGSFFPQYIHS